MSFNVSRRSLLSGAAGGLVVGALAGCGAPSLQVPKSAPQGTARRGGTMRIARPAASAAETLDPASSLSAYEYLGALYNRLVKLDRTGKTVPDLA